MKKIIITTLLVVAGIAAIAQNEKYIQHMKANIALLDSASTPEEWIAASAAFERIANVEKDQWLPYYYAALAQVWRGFNDNKADKEAVAAKASSYINKAEALEKNAEIAIIKNMIATLQMLVDPASRYMTYGAEAGKALAMAKQMEPNNPRVYFLEGQSMFGTPPQFGGGKDKAKPLFQKSIELYESYQPASELHPKWGKEITKAMLAQCE